MFLVEILSIGNEKIVVVGSLIAGLCRTLPHSAALRRSPPLTAICRTLPRSAAFSRSVTCLK
jgi:hypothetical protein